jgi:hypothetical protein
MPQYQKTRPRVAILIFSNVGLRGYVEGFSRFFVFGIDMELFLDGHIPNALSTFVSILKKGFLLYPA